MKISVFGAGYLGAVHATCMADLGHEVVAYDVDAAKITQLAKGRAPFYEPGLEELLAQTLRAGRLRFTDSIDDALADVDVFFVCVGTPQLSGSDAANVSYVDAAFDAIIAGADRDCLVVGKSTVPVGTAARLAGAAGAVQRAVRVEVAWNPEFLREGTAVEDTLHPDRLVFGVESVTAEKTLRAVYRAAIDGGTPCVVTDLATAEMVKVAANSFLATKVSFINAMAEICETAGADVVTLAEAIGYDARIGHRYLRAGLGFGGGCLPKDIRAFKARAGELGASDALMFLSEVDKINMRRRDKAVATASAMVGGSFLGVNVAVLGAAFKPDSDDVRDSPALNVAASIHLKGATVRVHDPRAIGNARKQFPTLDYRDSAVEACRDADLVLLATEWQEYQDLDPAALATVVRTPRVLDARNALDLTYWSDCGWQVAALGRGRHG